MIKKGLGSRDHRQEPDGEETGENFRVDRVFSAPASSTTLSAPRRSTGRTVPPTSVEAEGELALRRSLSRLQRQLADAQRELANKDEELAAEVERRLEVTQASEALQSAHDELSVKYIELDQYRARTSGLEQRLQDAIASGDELAHQLERERAERATISTQFDEANAAFERARALWRDESSLMGEHHASELVHRDAQKRAALEALESQMNAALERQRESHEAESAELKSAHERSLAALRGELEPKLAVARSLAEEIERLGSELAAARAEHVRDVTERVELHKWEMQQLVEAHAAQLETEARHHTTELDERDEEIEAKALALGQSERNATLREQLWEQTVAGLRESQKKLQLELAEAKEKCVQAEATKWSVEQRLLAVQSHQDKLNDELKAAKDRLDAAEADFKRSHLDRQRFVSYLEEGLAMMGAIPPTSNAGSVDASVDAGLNAVTVQGLSPVGDPEAKPPVRGKELKSS